MQSFSSLASLSPVTASVSACAGAFSVIASLDSLLSSTAGGATISNASGGGGCSLSLITLEEVSRWLLLLATSFEEVVECGNALGNPVASSATGSCSSFR
uniref:Putative secreted peptide n=1 Tax=Anopheles braziliensis TaxID=58242 RepID=A0A2M3ZSV1_9DIPT